MDSLNHGTGKCLKEKKRSTVTMHNHVPSKRGSEPVKPCHSKGARKAYMGCGGGERDQPMLKKNQRLSRPIRTVPMHCTRAERIIQFLFFFSPAREEP